MTQPIDETQRKALTLLIESFSRFAMLFGGFGKSWRRADHREFLIGACVRLQTIKQTSVAGSLGKIGRLWHRMYPWVNVTSNPDNPKRPNIVHTHKYFELLMLFPDVRMRRRTF